MIILYYMLKMVEKMKIVKIPFSRGSLGKNKGCEKGPDVLIEKLREFYVNEDGKLPDFSIEKPSLSLDNVDVLYAELSFLHGDVFLGGDHSITYGLFKGLHGKKKGLVIFDAHPDTEEGTSSVDHECFLRKLVEEKSVLPEHVFLVGLRSFSGKELRFLKDHSLRFVSMKQLFLNGIEETCDDVMEFCGQFDSLYLSLDIDVVDPAFAPGTGHLEPGGLTSRELLYFVQRMRL